MPRISGLVAILALTIAPAAAENAPTLIEIMQGLGDNLAEITDGLLRDDFEQVARGAAAIAAHPRIPAAEVALVAAELGPEMAAFKALDTRVHDLALETEAAALAPDRKAAVSGHRRLIDACLACHDTFKARVAAILDDSPSSK